MAGVTDVIGLGILLRFRDMATGQMKKAEEGLHKVGEEADEAVKKTAEVQASWAKLGKVGAVITGIGVAGAAGLYGIARAAGSFQDSLRDTMAMTGLTGKAFDEMEREVGDLSLSLSSRFGVAAVEVNKAFRQVLSAGAKAGSDQFRVLSESALMMANVVGQEPAAAVETLSDTLKAFQMDLSQASHMADVFVKSSMIGAATVPEMSQAMRQASKVAAELGLPLEEVAAILVGLANRGVKGGEAGMAFRAVMARLAGPSGEAADALGNLGVQVYDATTRRMRPAIDIFEDMKRGLAGLTQEEREAALKAVAGEESFTKLGAVLSLDISTLRGWSGELRKGGTLQTAFAQKTGTLGFAAAALKEDLRNTAIILGQALLPVVVPVVQKTAEWASRIGEFLKAHPGLAKVAVAFGAIATAVALVAGPILTVVGLIGSKGGVGAIVTSIGAGFMSLAGVAGTLGAALSAAFWPVTLAIASTAALYVAFRYNLLGIGTIVKTVAGVIWSYWKGLWDGVKAAMAPVIDLFGQTFAVLKEAFLPIWDAGKALGEMLGLWSDGSSAMQGFLDAALLVGKVVGYAIILPLRVLVQVNTWVIKGFAWLIKSASALGGWLGEKLGRNIDTVKNVLLFLLGPIGLVIRNFDKIKEGARLVVEWLAGNWSAIKEVLLAPIAPLLEGWAVLKDGLVSLFSAVRDAAASAFESIKASITEVLDWVWGKITWVISKIPDTLLPEGLLAVKREATGGGMPVGGQMVVPATAPAAQRAVPRPTMPREAGTLPTLALAASGGGPVDQSITIEAGAVVINATRVDESIVSKIEQELARILERRRERR